MATATAAASHRPATLATIAKAASATATPAIARALTKGAGGGRPTITASVWRG